MPEIEYLGIPRNRTRNTIRAGGPVYTMDHGYYELLGTSSSSVEECVSADWWHKRARANGSLPATPCVIGYHWRDPYAMTRATGTFRFNQHFVSDQGTTSVGGFDTVRPPVGSAARSTENALLTQELLAATNPFREGFSIPIAIKELVDLSSLFKIAADGFARYVGSSILTYKFGWTQFVRDVKTLHGITTAVERRIKEFQSLSKKGGIRRKVNLRSKSSNYSNPGVVIQSAWGVSITATTVGRYKTQTFGTCRWRYVEGFDAKLDQLQAFNLAVRKVFDLDELDGPTAWGLIPWSWLVDYFVNISDFFTANAGIGIVEPYDICIVRKSQSNFHRQITAKPASISISGRGHYGRYEYARDVTTRGSFPAVRVNLLNANQALVIAALLAVFGGKKG